MSCVWMSHVTNMKNEKEASGAASFLSFAFHGVQK